MQYTLQWYDRQTQHIHWHLAQRHTNTGQPSVTVALIKCQICNELQKSSHDQINQNISKAANMLKLSSKYLHVHICTVKQKKRNKVTHKLTLKSRLVTRRWETGTFLTSEYVRTFKNEETLSSEKER